MVPQKEDGPEVGPEVGMKKYVSIKFGVVEIKILKELFPDWKIQEKWISITLRGRTCIVL